jgi:peptidoglycan-N-acetylmuramic acid deacetylase
MRKAKTAAAILIMLLMLSQMGGMTPADEAGASPAAMEEEPAAEYTPAPEPAPAPAPTPEPAPVSSAEPISEPAVAIPDETAAIAGAAAAVETAPAQDAPVLPDAAVLSAEPAAGAVTLPVIPPGAPAPAQIKRLPDSGMVCLTFDDGYGEASIRKVLDCLRQYGVQCTFFIIGDCLKRYPALWRQAVEDGHEIAYHTMKHRPLNGMSNENIVEDINQWNDTAHSVLGMGYRIPKIGRAPGGSANARVRRLFDAIGYKLIYWSSDTYTGVYRSGKKNAASRIASYIIRKTTAGSISLQHFNACDASSLPRYIETLQSRFTLGTVSQALAAGG